MTLLSESGVKHLMDKKFSIIIPNYNKEEYIEETLNSIFNQTYKNFEVIVIDDASSDNSIEKIKEYPTFHAGPIIRREYPFDNMEMKDRKKIFQSIFMFTLSLPIKFFSFCYEKKNFNSDLLKMQAKITKDVYNFLLDNFDYLNAFDEIIIYYDNGQNLITKILNGAFAISGLNYEFKKEVAPGSYRLFQVADFVSTIKLMEIKLNKNELSNSELKFVDVYHLKKNYIKGVNKKLLKR